MVLVLIRVWLGLMSARGSGMRSVCASAHGACREGGNGCANKPEPGHARGSVCWPRAGQGLCLELKPLHLSCTGEYGHISVLCCHFPLRKTNLLGFVVPVAPQGQAMTAKTRDSLRGAVCRRLMSHGARSARAGLGWVCGVLRAHTAVFPRREQEAVASIAAPRSHRDFRAARAPAAAASGSRALLVAWPDPCRAQSPVRVGGSGAGHGGGKRSMGEVGLFVLSERGSGERAEPAAPVSKPPSWPLLPP